MAAVWYVVRVLVKAGRDPTRLGAWLPRLLASWHIGMTELEKARREHEEAKQKRTKQKPTRAAAEAPRELPAGDVTVTRAGEQAEDKVVASQSEERRREAEVRRGSARMLPHHPRSRARHRVRT
jgi:hypothetical protein